MARGDNVNNPKGGKTGPLAPPAPEKPSTPPAGAVPSAPAARPGTSGTELLLVTNTRRASDKYRQAQRAERTYKAKKRSAVARADITDAKAHYKEGFAHLRAAAKLTFSVVRLAPYILFEKSDASQAKADEKKRAKAAERRKKLEEALAKEDKEANDEGTVGGDESDEAEGATNGKKR